MSECVLWGAAAVDAPTLRALVYVCVSVCVCVCACACVRACVHARVNVRVHACGTRMHRCAERARDCRCVYVSVRMHMQTYVHVCICTFVRIDTGAHLSDYVCTSIVGEHIPSKAIINESTVSESILASVYWRVYEQHL